MVFGTTPHDALFRTLLEDEARAGEILRGFLPGDIAHRLGDESPKPMPGTFVDEELRNSQSDALFRLRLVDGQTVYVYVLLEHKSAPDPQTPLQLLRYMTRIWDRHPIDAADDHDGSLPAILPIVVYHGTEPWRIPRSIVDTLRASPDIRAHLRDLRYSLVDLNRTADEALPGDPEARSGLMALKYAFRRDGVERLNDILTGLSAGSLLEGKVVRYIMGVFRDLTPDRVRAAARQVRPELEAEMVSLVEYCREEGRVEGREEGLMLGEASGRIQAILSALEVRFGTVDRELADRVRATPSDRLDALLRRVLTAGTLDEVFPPERD